MIHIFFLILVLLAGSFLFNLAEMTFLTLDRAEYAALKQNNPRGAELISRVISSPARLFATLLLGIHASLTSANILTSHLLISLPLTARHRELILLIYACVVVLFAEALPQVLGVRHGSSLSLLLVRPVQGVIFLLAPLTKFVEVLFRSLHHQEPAPYLERASWRTEDILRLASGALPQTISSSISRFISAKNQPISALLRPAAQTVFISETDTLQSVIQKFSTSGFSRLPYWKSGPARFFAYLHIKDVLAMLAQNESDWKRFLHPLPVFTPNTSILKAFTSLRSLGAHIAAVATPDGRIAGIVTMDDLLHFFIGPHHPAPAEPEVTHLSSPVVPRSPD